MGKTRQGGWGRFGRQTCDTELTTQQPLAYLYQTWTVWRCYKDGQDQWVLSFREGNKIDDSQQRHTRESAYRWVRGFTGAAVNTVHRTTNTTGGNQKTRIFRLVGLVMVGKRDNHRVRW
ncbi:unnamed protein product [Ectocarpus sp. 8 AP-2014]